MTEHVLRGEETDEGVDFYLVTLAETPDGTPAGVVTEHAGWLSEDALHALVEAVRHWIEETST